MDRQSRFRSILISVGCHIAIIVGLVFSFERNIPLLASPAAQKEQEKQEKQEKPIIDAVIVDHKAVKQEVQRLAQVEQAKRAKEDARRREMAQKEKEANEKRAQEKEAAEQQRLAKIAQEKREKEEKATLARLAKEQERLAQEKKVQEAKAQAQAQEKKAQEDALKKIEKQKAEEARKIAEVAIKRQISPRARDEYRALIRSILHQNWTRPTGDDLTGLTCVVLVDLLPTGEVARVTVTRSSGNLALDRSAEKAVYKAAPLPMPEEPALLEEARQFEFTFNPEAV